MEKSDNAILTYFWDLASSDDQSRTNAAYMIVSRIKDIGNGAELDYTLKRLVKGLSSSRDSARLGFATCLTEIIQCMSVSPELVLKLLDENTMITGSMKGSEERDLIFGKIFCYLTLIRSGLKVNKVDLLNRIVALHSKKGWIREVTTDAILQVLSSMSKDDNMEGVLQVVLELASFEDEIENGWELMLLIGLQSLAIRNPDISSFLREKRPRMLTINAFDEDLLVSVLLKCTAGFPKLHRAWDYVMSAVFALDADLLLVTKRSAALTAAQEATLVRLGRMIDTYFLSGTAEKRCVGIIVKLVLLKLVPAVAVPLVVTKTFVRCLLSIRVNKKHTLFAFAGSALDEIRHAVEDDMKSKLAVVSLFLQHSGVSFDAQAHWKFIGPMVEGLDGAAILEYMRFLCGSIHVFLHHKKSHDAAASKKASNADGDDAAAEEEDAYEFHRVAAVAALDGMVSLIRNSKIVDRAPLIHAVVTVLVRMAYFSTSSDAACQRIKADATGSAQVKEEKKGKKSKDKKSLSSAPSTVNTLLLSLEGLKNVLAIDAESDTALEENIAVLSSVAQRKLLSLLGDFGRMSLEQIVAGHNPDSKEGDDQQAAAAKQGATLLEICVYAADYFFREPALKLGCLVENAAAIEESFGSEEGFVDVLRDVLQHLVGHVAGTGKAESAEGLHERLKQSLYHLLGQAFLFSLTSYSEIDFQTVDSLSKVVPDLLATLTDADTKKVKKEAAAAEDEDEEEGNCILHFFELTMDLLSVSSDHAVKGLREGCKRSWGVISYLQGNYLEYDVVNAIVEAVVGESLQEDDEKDEDDEEGGDDEIDEEEGEKALKAPKKSKAEKKAEKAAALAHGEEEDDEDIVISQEEALEMLAEGLEDDDEEEEDASAGDKEGQEEEMDLESQGANAEEEALQHMISLRKQNRKQGLLQALRRQLLIRSRAVDILEIVVNRVDMGDLLFPLFLPLCTCYFKTMRSKLAQSIAEGRTFTSRLQSFLDNKLFKKRFHMVTEGDADAETDLLEEFQLLNTLLVKHCTSKEQAVRAVATQGFSTAARVIIGSDCEAAKAALLSTVQELFGRFSSKKHSGLHVKFFEDLLVNRFADFFLPSMLALCVEAVHSTKVGFVRGELCALIEKAFAKYSGSAEALKAVFESQYAAAVGALGHEISCVLEDTKSADAASSGVAKKLKPHVHSLKFLLELPKKHPSLLSEQLKGALPAAITLHKHLKVMFVKSSEEGGEKSKKSKKGDSTAVPNMLSVMDSVLAVLSSDLAAKFKDDAAPSTGKKAKKEAKKSKRDEHNEPEDIPSLDMAEVKLLQRLNAAPAGNSAASSSNATAADVSKKGKWFDAEGESKGKKSKKRASPAAREEEEGVEAGAGAEKVKKHKSKR